MSRALAEELVARLRNAPGDFADARALAASAGLTPRALDALLREHYHADAATTVRGERVAAGVADDDDVRAVRSMPRAAYARLGRSRSFTLSLPGDFHRKVPLRWLGRDAESRTERVNGNSIAKALVLDGMPAVLTIELSKGASNADVGNVRDARRNLATTELRNPSIARCTVDRPVGAGGMRAAHDAAVRMLGLVADPAPFERRAARDPFVRRLVRHRPGLRVPLTSTVFEALVWTIAGQQVNLAFAYRLRRVVIELSGTVVDGFIAHPTAGQVARLDYADLTGRQWSRRKAEYVIDVARDVAGGALDAEALPRDSATSVRERLESLRGFGAWSANYVMMRGCGLADCVPLGDSGLTTALQRFFALRDRPDRAKTEELMAHFAPFRSLATFHFWAGFDDVDAGVRSRVESGSGGSATGSMSGRPLSTVDLTPRLAPDGGRDD